MEFSIALEQIDDKTQKVVVNGRLNAFSAKEFKDLLGNSVSEAVPNVVVDMNNVQFVDSSGLACLVSGLKTARGVGGFFRIYGAQDQVLSVLKLTQLNRVFENYDDQDTAIRGSGDSSSSE